MCNFIITNIINRDKVHRLLQYYHTVFLKCVKNWHNYYYSIIVLNCVMCVEARYLIQYIHFSFHRFCDATVFNYRQATQWLRQCVKLLPPVLAAHAGNIESIVAQITLTMCFLRSQKNFHSVSTVLYSSILRRTISQKRV